MAGLMILDEFGVDIRPVLTGAGIAGLAVGFGAQTLVRDIISGFFLIVEDQVRVSDVAVVNGTGGLVEAIHLRTIVLRDEEAVGRGARAAETDRAGFKARGIDIAVTRRAFLIKSEGAEGALGSQGAEGPVQHVQHTEPRNRTP
jgi:hypothetical protein